MTQLQTTGDGVSAAPRLPTPAELTASEKRGLRIIQNHPRLLRTKNGYRQAGGGFITLRMVERLEALHLARQVVAKARATVVLTGSGMTVLAVLDERQAAKGGRA